MNATLEIASTRKCECRALVARSLAVLALIGTPALASAQSVDHAAHHQDAKISIVFATKPAAPTVGENTFLVTVKDAKGEPILGADVAVEIVMPPMPAMQMPEMRRTVALKASVDPKDAAEGVYVGTGRIAMPGRWNVTVTVKADGKDIGEKKLNVMVKR